MRPAIRVFATTQVLCLSLVAAGCVSGSAQRAKSAIIQADIDRARSTDAYRCAPRELALAEAHLDFAAGEYSEGNSLRADEHLTIAEENARKAVLLSRDCGPKKILIAAPPPVLKVERVDRDGDGIVDNEDVCPDVPGVVESRGCPLVIDTDGDGIPDDVDRCPNDAEDMDVFDDEDGCPDPDNDGDDVLDIDDACAYEAGVASADPKKHGCPVYDRDGDGIFDDDDACPDEPGVADADPKKNGCPVRDRDGDTILDDVDACPDEPGVADVDPKKNGCPVRDRDGDGILDDVDACPDKPGVADRNPKKNGCPRKLRMVVIKEDKIEIKQQINFATGKAIIRGKKSFQILDEVILVLNDNPRIKKLRVEGHTDSTGKKAFNVKLSQSRAQAVVDYMVKKGIDPERLEAMGFGPEKPIAPNNTAKGRALNRLTEFNIINQ